MLAASVVMEGVEGEEGVGVEGGREAGLLEAKRSRKYMRYCMDRSEDRAVENTTEYKSERNQDLPTTHLARGFTFSFKLRCAEGKS